MEDILKIKKATKHYGKIRGIDDINLDIKKGEVYGFIGPNGAGKSTTIKCIMNLIKSNAGEIYVEGKKINNKSYNINENIGYLPSEIHLYEDLTVEKMIKYSASFYKKDCKKKTDELVKKLDLDITKKIDQLSLGNLKKVGIVLALMHDPQFIIMDEAANGLDPLMQEVFYKIIEEEKKNGKTIFFSSHILNEVKRVCDKVAIIKEGKIIKIEDIKNLEKSNIIKAKIQSKEIEKIIGELSVEKINEKDKESAEIIFSADINQLIKTLSKYEIKKLTIQELDIEDEFLQYFE